MQNFNCFDRESLQNGRLIAVKKLSAQEIASHKCSTLHKKRINLKIYLVKSSLGERICGRSKNSQASNKKNVVHLFICCTDGIFIPSSNGKRNVSGIFSGNKDKSAEKKREAFRS